MDDQRWYTSTDVERSAGEFYTRYCEAVGGKAFNGSPLPPWDTFRNDAAKKTQSDAWVAVATLAYKKLY